MDVIPFIADRFASAAASYCEGRPPYPELLFRRIAQLGGLAPGHRVLDLGCGPGQIAIGLAPFAGEVVAMDPEPAMLDIARQEARHRGVAISLVEGSSYDIDETLGRFDLVAIRRAFGTVSRGRSRRWHLLAVHC